MIRIWQALPLGNRIRHDADRVGGCDLILPWPEGLPLGEPRAEDEERDTTPGEHTAAEQIIGEACRTAGIVPVRSVAASLRRPSTLPRGGAAEVVPNGPEVPAAVDRLILRVAP